MKHISRSRLAGTLGVLVALSLTLDQTGCASIENLRISQSATPRATATHLTTRVPTPIPEVWTSIVPPPAAVALRFAPSDPLIAYMCADDGPPRAPAPATPRLYTSFDGAMTWHLLLGAPVMRLVDNLTPTIIACSIFVSAHNPLGIFLQETQTDPENPDHISASALYQSYDGGVTWYPIHAPHGSAGFSFVAVVQSRLIAVVIPHVYDSSACDPFRMSPRATSLLYASDDSGATWKHLGKAIEAAGYSPRAMKMVAGLIFATADQVPHAACQRPAKSTLWRSNDGGATWKRTLLAEPNIQTTSFAKGVAHSYYGIATIAEGKTVQTLFSRNWGYTWFTVRGLTTPAHAHFINTVIAPDGIAMAQADGGAMIYKCNLNDASPQWVAFMPGATTAPQTWRVEQLQQGALLWSLAFSYDAPMRPSTLAYLSLP